MSDEPEPRCVIRRRRLAGNPNMALNLEVGYQVNEGCSSMGTPSPSYIDLTPSATPTSARLLHEFKNRQQSFDVQIEECEEEEIIIESDEETEDNATGAAAAAMPSRPITPTPVQDFGTSVVYTEGPQPSDFLQVKGFEQECYTDVSDAETDDEAEPEI